MESSCIERFKFLTAELFLSITSLENQAPIKAQMPAEIPLKPLKTYKAAAAFHHLFYIMQLSGQLFCIIHKSTLKHKVNKKICSLK